MQCEFLFQSLVPFWLFSLKSGSIFWVYSSPSSYFSRHRNVVGCVRQWFTVKHNWLDLSENMFFWDSVCGKNIESTCVVFSCCHWHPEVNSWSVFSFLKTFLFFFVLMWLSSFSKLTPDAKIASILAFSPGLCFVWIMGSVHHCYHSPL